MGVPLDEEDRQIVSAGRAYRRAEDALRRRRTELHERMFTAVRGGKTKSYVARLAGYTREHLTELMRTDGKRRADEAAKDSAEAN